MDGGDRLMERLLRKASQQFDQAEVYSCEIQTLHGSASSSGRLAVRAALQRDTALRVVAGGRVYLTSASGALPALPPAHVVQELGHPWCGRFPAPAVCPQVTTYDPQVDGFSLSDVAAQAMDLRTALVGVAPATPFTVWVQATRERTRIANSSGLQVSFRRTGYLVGIGEDVVAASCHFQPLTEEQVARLGNRLQAAAVVEPPETGNCQVYLEPPVVLSLLQRLVEGVRADAVMAGLSPLGQRPGQVIFDPRLHIVDDPLVPLGYHSRPFDDEGVPTATRTLVDTGRLAGCLGDLLTAGSGARAGNGYKCNANGGGIAVAPNPQATNLLLRPGADRPDAMVAAIENGVIIASTFGTDEGNIPQGEFSFNLRRSWRVVNGKITGAIKNVSMTGNIYDLLRDHLQAIGDGCEPGNLYDNVHPRRVGFAPPLLLHGIRLRSS